MTAFLCLIIGYFVGSFASIALILWLYYEHLVTLTADVERWERTHPAMPRSTYTPERLIDINIPS